MGVPPYYAVCPVFTPPPFHDSDHRACKPEISIVSNAVTAHLHSGKVAVGQPIKPAPNSLSPSPASFASPLDLARVVPAIAGPMRHRASLPSQLPCLPLLSASFLLFFFSPAAGEVALQHKLADKAVLPSGILALHIRGLADVPPNGVFSTLLRRRRGAERAYVELAEVMEDSIQDSNCFLRDGGWAKAAADFYKLRGWEPANGACSSSTTQTMRPSRFTPAEAFSRLRAAGDFTDAIKDQVRKETMRNFTKAFHPRALSLDRGTRINQKCVTERTTGLRVLSSKQPSWYILSGITNAENDVDLQAWERQFVTELVGVNLKSKKFIDPLVQFVTPAGEAGERKRRANFLTTFEMWSGRISSSGIFDLPIAEAPAVIMAVEKMDLDVDQARDAVTASNIAILALPMIINLIPVSLLADVSTIGLMAYTLLTDIVTTVPFIIKGFELIQMGGREYRDQAAWFRGKKHEQYLLAELWVTNCRILHVRKLGIGFVVVGFAVMGLGILAEIVAKRLRRKWRENEGSSKNALKHVRLAVLGMDQDASGQPRPGVQGLHFDSDDEEAAFAAQQVASKNVPRS